MNTCNPRGREGISQTSSECCNQKSIGLKRDPTVLNKIGVCLIYDGYILNALEILEEILILNLDDLSRSQTLSKKALALDLITEKEKALCIFEEALSICPLNYQARGNVLICLLHSCENEDYVLQEHKKINGFVRAFEKGVVSGNKKIWLISGDFENHSVSNFITNFIKANEEIVIFSQSVLSGEYKSKLFIINKITAEETCALIKGWPKFKSLVK